MPFGRHRAVISCCLCQEQILIEITFAQADLTLHPRNKEKKKKKRRKKKTKIEKKKQKQGKEDMARTSLNGGRKSC